MQARRLYAGNLIQRCFVFTIVQTTKAMFMIHLPLRKSVTYKVYLVSFSSDFCSVHFRLSCFRKLILLRYKSKLQIFRRMQCIWNTHPYWLIRFSFNHQFLLYISNCRICCCSGTQSYVCEWLLRILDLRSYGNEYFSESPRILINNMSIF